MKDMLNSPIVIEAWNWLVSEKGIETAVAVLGACVILFSPLINAARFLLVWLIQCRPLSLRKWAALATDAEPIEKAVGFRAAGPIYYTPESWPRFYLMHASNRVFTDDEEYFSHDEGMKFALIKQSSPMTLPRMISIRNDVDAKSDLALLYNKAARSAGPWPQ